MSGFVVVTLVQFLRFAACFHDNKQVKWFGLGPFESGFNWNQFVHIGGSNPEATQNTSNEFQSNISLKCFAHVQGHLT